MINQYLFECIDMNLIKNFGLQKIFFSLSFKSCTTNLLQIGSNRFYSSFEPFGKCDHLNDDNLVPVTRILTFE